MYPLVVEGIANGLIHTESRFDAVLLLPLQAGMCRRVWGCDRMNSPFHLWQNVTASSMTDPNQYPAAGAAFARLDGQRKSEDKDQGDQESWPHLTPPVS
jgi:hypothetical protein